MRHNWLCFIIDLPLYWVRKSWKAFPLRGSTGWNSLSWKKPSFIINWWAEILDSQCSPVWGKAGCTLGPEDSLKTCISRTSVMLCQSAQNISLEFECIARFSTQWIVYSVWSLEPFHPAHLINLYVYTKLLLKVNAQWLLPTFFNS